MVLFFSLLAVSHAQKDTAYFMQHYRQGNVMHNSGKIDSAIHFYEKAYEWSKQNTFFDTSVHVTQLFSIMGRCYRVLDNVNASHQMLTKAFQQARKHEHIAAIKDILARMTKLHEYIVDNNKAFKYPSVTETETANAYFPIRKINKLGNDSLALIIAAGRLDGIINNSKFNTVESRTIEGDTAHHKSVHTIVSAPMHEIADNYVVVHISNTYADKILPNDFYVCQVEIPVSWRALSLKPFLMDNVCFTDGTNRLYSYRYFYYYGNVELEKETLQAFHYTAKEAALSIAKDTLTNPDRAAKYEGGIFSGQNMFGAVIRSLPNHQQLFLQYNQQFPGTYMGNSPNYNVEFARWVATASPLDKNSIKPYLLSIENRAERQQQALQLFNQINKNELVEAWLGEGLQQVIDDNLNEAMQTAILIQDVTTANKDTTNYGWSDYLWATIHHKSVLKEKAMESLAIAEAKFKAYKNIEGIFWVSTSKEKWEKPIETSVNKQSGHARTYIVAQAPNGKYFATGGTDRLIKIWDKASGKELHTITYHNGGITSLHYSPNGKYLVSAAQDKTVTVWNTYNYTPVAGFTTDAPSYVSKFSPDSKLLYVTEDSVLNIIKPFTDTFTLIKKIVLHHNTINDFEFYNNDANRIYTCSDDGAIYRWNIRDSIIERQWTDLDKIKDITLSNNGRFMSAITKDSTLKLYDLTNSDLRFTFKVYIEANEYNNSIPARYNIQSFSPNNQLLAYPVTPDSLEILNLIDFYSRKYKVIHDKQLIRQCLFSPDGKDMLVINDGLFVKLLNFRNYDFNTKYQLNSSFIKFYSNEIYQVQYYQNDNVLFYLQTGPSLAWFNLSDGSLKRKAFEEIDYTLESKKIVLTGDSLFAIKLKSYPTALAIYSITGDVAVRSTIILPNNERVKAFDPTPDNKTCFVTGKNGRLIKWDITNDKEIFSTTLQTDTSDYAMHLHYDQYKHKLFVVGSTSSIYVIDANTGKVTDTLYTSNGKYILTSPQYIFITTGNGQLIQYPADTLSIKYSRNMNNTAASCGSMILSKDNSVLVVQNTLNSLCAINTVNDAILYQVPDHNFTSWSITLSNDGKEFATAGADGTIHLYETLTGKRKATVHAPFNKDPFIVDDEKHYYANKSTLDAINISYNDNVYNYDQFDVQLNRPDLIFKKLGRSDTSLVKLYQNAYKKRIKKMGISEKNSGLDIHLPTIKLKNKFAINSYTSSKDYTLEIDCKDSKYLLQRLHVLVNNSPVVGVNGRDLSKLQTKSSIQTVTIPLARGINTVKVYCTNNQGVNSLKETFTINSSDTTQPKGIVYFVGIGVATYKDPNMNLTYSVKDIRDLAKDFEKYQTDVVIDTLINEKVTLENILKLKAKLQKTTPNDRVVIAVTGHGLLSDSLDFYYATYDVDFTKPEKRGLPYEQLEGLLDDVPAQEKIMLIDACHSGALDKDDLLSAKKSNSLFESDNKTDVNVKSIASRGAVALKNKKIKAPLNNSFELMQTQFSDLSRSNGAVVISAAGGTEFAYESPKWNNGVFTYAVREGIFDEYADKYYDGDNDGTVSIKELAAYVNARVKDLTGGKQKPTARRENFDFNWVLRW
jgi:WD40 repeat protein